MTDDATAALGACNSERVSRTPAVTVVAEQLRHKVPGGIGTYVRGLLRGLDGAETGDLRVTPWTSRLPVPARTRLWEYGVGRVPGDIVHATSLAFPPRVARLVVMLHDVAWRDAPETFGRRGRAWHERMLSRAAGVARSFVVPSTVTADKVVDAGVDRDRVVVIEEGCDHLPRPDNAGAEAVVRGDFILSVGTLQPRKNLTRVFDAYARARPSLPGPWPLVVVGPRGWGPGQTPAEGVEFAGAVDGAVLAALYRRARALVYVPLAEGFGLPPVEAMFAGAPVVASTRVPSTQGAAMEVDPYDVDAIASAMVDAAVDGPTRGRLIAAGHERARGLTWRRAAEQHIALWKSLL